MLQGDPGDHRIGQADGLADTVETGTNPAEWEHAFDFQRGVGRVILRAQLRRG